MRRESPAENRQTGPDFFRKLFLYSPIGMVIGDRKGNILEVNPAMERILGYSAEEFKTLDAKAITHPDDYEKEISFIRSLFDEEAQGKQFRKRYIHRDGSVVQCILTASVICGCDGEPYRLIAHVQDYTEIENASRQLKKSEEAFDTLYRHNPDVLCIISEDMTIRSINRTATDCRPEEINGRQVNDKETSGMEIQDRDGMTWFSRFVPLPDDNNGRRFLIISTDTTEVEQLRKIADRRDAQLRTVTMAMPDIPFVLNGEGRYVDVVTDKEHLLYDTVSRLKGRLLHDVLPVEVADEAVRIVRQTIETGQSQSMDYQLEVPAGLRWFEGRTALMPVEKTDEPLVVFVARDVTERVEAISALREATLFRDRILDTIPEIIYTYDFSTGKTRFANERLSEILGIEAAQMKDSDGHFIEGFLAENQTSQYSDHLRQMASADDGEVVSTEFVIQTGQRRLRLLCREAVLYRAADGRPREILGSALDVSEMRQTEEALRRSEERVRTFIETA
ncbi:MAG: PAS domain-containing protein, partial [Candidatus Sumerlaeota bacterium]